MLTAEQYIKSDQLWNAAGGDYVPPPMLQNLHDPDSEVYENGETICMVEKKHPETGEVIFDMVVKTKQERELELAQKAKATQR